MNSISPVRRPVTSRDSKLAKQAAYWLAKNNVSPNFISIFSIVFAALSLLACYLDFKMMTNHVILMIIVLIGIQGRLLMNLLDGMVAIEHQKKSMVGSLFNEVPDRISDSIIIFGIGLLAGKFTYGMDLSYIAIILSILTAYIRVLGDSLNFGPNFIGPMAKQHRMALISIACIIGIWYTPIFYFILILMNAGLILTCYRRLARIYNFLKFSNIQIK